MTLNRVLNLTLIRLIRSSTNQVYLSFQRRVFWTALRWYAWRKCSRTMSVFATGSRLNNYIKKYLRKIYLPSRVPDFLTTSATDDLRASSFVNYGVDEEMKEKKILNNPWNPDETLDFSRLQIETMDCWKKDFGRCFRRQERASECRRYQSKFRNRRFYSYRDGS
jgi:hypothetical protein